MGTKLEYIENANPKANAKQKKSVRPYFAILKHIFIHSNMILCVHENSDDDDTNLDQTYSLVG